MRWLRSACSESAAFPATTGSSEPASTRTRCRSPATSSAVEENVELVRPTGRRGLREQLDWADVLVVAAVVPTSPTVVLDAQAAGLAVVTTEAPPAGADGAIVVPRRDASALADALARIASDMDLRRRLAEAGRRAATASQDLDDQLRRFRDLYRTVLSAGAVTTKRPSVSVVVPAFDAARTITDCVRSLTALEYPRDRLEIVVVDNGSRDRTRALLEAFGEAIRIVDEPRRGPAAARNAGVRSARGDVIAFTDADCTVDPRWLLPLVAALEDPGVGIAGGPILSRRPANAVERFGERIHDHRRALTEFEPPYAITMNWASRRAVLEAVGLFDVRLRRCEDGDLSYRIREHGYSFAYVPEAIVYHRNQRTVAGLVREGWEHGFHAHPVRRRHASFIAAFRARIAALRVRSVERKRTASGPGGRAEDRSYERAFAFGKRTGRASGRLWFTFSRAPSAGAARKPGGATLQLQRLALRTQRGPTRRVWSGLHAGALGFVTQAIRWRERDTAVYVKGSFAFDDPVYGLSDIDMVVVTPDHPSRPGENRVRVQRRWQRLGRVPPLRQLFQHSSVYEESELREVTDATCFTYGTGPGGKTSASHLGARPLPDELALLSHPPLSSPHREWRLVAGPERRNGTSISDAQGRRIAGWLELQFLWKLAYLAAREPDSPHVPYLCVKLVADPVRILLWIADGELVLRRKDALVRGLCRPAGGGTRAAAGARPGRAARPRSDRLARGVLPLVRRPVVADRRPDRGGHWRSTARPPSGCSRARSPISQSGCRRVRAFGGSFRRECRRGSCRSSTGGRSSCPRRPTRRSRSFPGTATRSPRSAGSPRSFLPASTPRCVWTASCSSPRGCSPTEPFSAP